MSPPVTGNQVVLRYPLAPVQKLWLRLVGTGVVLLTERPFANFLRYYGQLWLLGHWVLDQWGLTEKREVDG